MDNKNKKGNKFNFMTIVEEDGDTVEIDDSLDNNYYGNDDIKEESTEKVDYKDAELIEDNNKEATVEEGMIDKNNIHEEVSNKKVHFSFAFRIIIYVFFILLFGLIAVLFGLQAFNFGKEKIVNYNEIASINYSVCSDNNVSNCLSEGGNYESNKTELIQTTLKYNKTFTDLVFYDLSYIVVATTKVYDKNDSSKVVYSDDDLLVENTPIKGEGKDITIDTSVDIDYNKYNAQAANYKSKYAKDSPADLEVKLIINEGNDTRIITSYKLPLTVSNFRISKTNFSEVNNKVKLHVNTWDDYNSTCCIIACLFVILTLLFIYRLINFILKVSINKNKYQVYLNDLLREYDRIIVIARDGYESNIEKEEIKVVSFDELLDVKDTLRKPIIYSRVNDVKSDFIVEDDNKLYKFTVKEADFLKEK